MNINLMSGSKAIAISRIVSAVCTDVMYRVAVHGWGMAYTWVGRRMCWTVRRVGGAWVGRCMCWTVHIGWAVHGLGSVCVGLCIGWAVHRLNGAWVGRCMGWTVHRLGGAWVGRCMGWAMHELGGALIRRCMGWAGGAWVGRYTVCAQSALHKHWVTIHTFIGRCKCGCASRSCKCSKQL